MGLCKYSYIHTSTRILLLCAAVETTRITYVRVRAGLGIASNTCPRLKKVKDLAPKGTSRELLMSRRTDPGVVFKVTEARFTPGKTRLHSASVLLQTETGEYASPFVSPEPADFVSMRSKCVFPDASIRVPVTCVNSKVKIVLVNRRRFLRTVIGTIEFGLKDLDPPLTTRDSFKRTLHMHTALFPALNVKIDVELSLEANVDKWQRLIPRSAKPSIHARSVKSLKLSRTRSKTQEIETKSVDSISLNSTDMSSASSLLSSQKSTQSTPPTLMQDSSSISARTRPGKPPPILENANNHLLDAKTPRFSTDSRHAILNTHSPQPSTNSVTESSRSNASTVESTAELSSLGHGPLESLDSAVSYDSVKSTASLGKPAAKSSTKTKFSFSLDKDTLGVVFLELVSVANLPKFRTLTGISFDMDPFIVLSFGKRVYRTPHKRHTLNPTFNSKVAFDVHSKERSFPLIFSVWDQDKITLNDKVATCELPVSMIIEEHSPAIDPATGLYDVGSHKACTLMLPLRHAAGTAEMMIKVHFYPLAAIRQQMWRGVISLYEDQKPSITYDALCALLNSLGSSLSEDDIKKFFINCKLDPTVDEISEDDVVKSLETIATEQSDRIILFRICPICHKKNPFNKNYGKKQSNSSLGHLALCASRHWAESSVLLSDKYISAEQASKRWYANFLSKFSFGSYKLGAHSANILVQDRITGQIFEEKMRTYIRIGIRLIYALGPVEMRRFQNLLKQYTLRSGIKYSSPTSAENIQPFVKFHNLDMSEVLEPVQNFKTFNEFFYRKLKPDARPCENSAEPRTVVSMADCRLTTFETVKNATELWIKGKNFTIEQLIGSTYPSLAKNYINGSIVIFRLAPQDYHRVHSPVNGIMGQPKHIPGEYFSVNPMAVRSHLDVFGENARTVFPIESKEFGTVLVVMVGAMMVGSCVVEAEEGQELHRADDIGYFKFGGSTVVLLFEPGKFVADSDLQANSNSRIETCVKVGMSIGHAPGVPEYNRTYDTRPATIRRAKSTILGGGSYLPFSLD